VGSRHCEAAWITKYISIITNKISKVKSWETTDWARIVALHGRLLASAPSSVVRLNRAIARWQIVGPAAALAEVEPLATPLARYHHFHAPRGELPRALLERHVG